MLKRIKPAGWLAIAVLALLALSFVLWGYRAISTFIEARRLANPEPIVFVPTPTRTPKPTPTPLPKGWQEVTDIITGKTYLAPPPEEEKKIREAFNALFALYVIEDADDATLKKFDLEAAKKRLYEYATKEIADWYASWSSVIIRKVGPDNPVRCKDQSECTLAKAGIGFLGVLSYSPSMCQANKQTAPCVLRVGQYKIKTDTPYGVAIIATLRKEGGKWVIVKVDAQPLPQPVP